MAEPAQGSRSQPTDARAAELALVLWSSALAVFCLGLPRVFTGAAAFSLFLGVYDASLIPLSYVAAALLVPIAGYVYLKLEEWLPFVTLLIVALLADAAVLAALRLFMRLGGPDWLALAAIVWVEVDWVIGSLVFWGLASAPLTCGRARGTSATSAPANRRRSSPGGSSRP